MTNKDIDEYTKLCRDYGPKSEGVFRIEFDRMKSLKAKLEGKLEDSEKLRGLPIPEECNELNRISLSNYLEELEQEIKQLKEDWVSKQNRIETLESLNLDLNKIISNLKQKLEKVKEYVNSKMYSNDEKFNKFIEKLKEKLK